MWTRTGKAIFNALIGAGVIFGLIFIGIIADKNRITAQDPATKTIVDEMVFYKQQKTGLCFGVIETERYKLAAVQVNCVDVRKELKNE